MNRKINRKSFYKALILIIILLGIGLGGVELLFLVDLGGLDFAVGFLILYFATIRDTISHKISKCRSSLKDLSKQIADLYIFRPKVYLAHTALSGVVVYLTWSIYLGCILWVPVIIYSAAQY